MHNRFVHSQSVHNCFYNSRGACRCSKEQSRHLGDSKVDSRTFRHAVLIFSAAFLIALKCTLQSFTRLDSSFAAPARLSHRYAVQQQLSLQQLCISAAFLIMQILHCYQMLRPFLLYLHRLSYLYVVHQPHSFISSCWERQFGLTWCVFHCPSFAAISHQDIGKYSERTKHAYCMQLSEYSLHYSSRDKTFNLLLAAMLYKCTDR